MQKKIKIVYITIFFVLSCSSSLFAQRLVVNGKIDFISRYEVLNKDEKNLLFGNGRKVDLLRNGVMGTNVNTLIHQATGIIDTNIKQELANTIQDSNNPVNKLFLEYINNSRYNRLDWEQEKAKYLAEAVTLGDTQTANNNVAILEAGNFIINGETYDVRKKYYMIFHDENGSIPYYVPDAYYYINSNEDFIFHEYCVHNCELMVDSYFDDYYHDSTGKMYKYNDKNGTKSLIESQEIFDGPGYTINLYMGYLDNKELIENGTYTVNIDINGNERQKYSFKKYKAKYYDPIKDITIDNVYYAMDDLLNIGGFNMIEPQIKDAYYIGKNKFHNLKINHQGIFYVDGVEDSYSLFSGDYTMNDEYKDIIPNSLFNDGESEQTKSIRLKPYGSVNINTINSNYLILRTYMLPVILDKGQDYSERKDININKNIIDLEIYKDDVLYQTLTTNNLMNSLLIDTKNCNKVTCKILVKTKTINTKNENGDINAPIDPKVLQGKAKIYNPNSNEDYSKQGMSDVVTMDDIDNSYSINLSAYMVI